MAIPAYQKYQDNAKSSVVTRSLNIVKNSFQACRTLGGVAGCQTLEQIGVEKEDGIGITSTPNSDDPVTRVCFKVNAKDGFEGCWDSNKQSAKGVPVGTSCSSEAVQSCDGTTLKCGGGCTRVAGACGGADNSPDNSADCGTGETTSAISVSCDAGVCS